MGITFKKTFIFFIILAILFIIYHLADFDVQDDKFITNKKVNNINLGTNIKIDTPVKNENTKKEDVDNEDQLYFKIKNRTELKKIAIEQSVLLYDQNPLLGVRFETSVASEPIRVRDDCTSKDLEIVILHKNDDISGIVIFRYAKDKELDLAIISPTNYASNGTVPEYESPPSTRRLGDKEVYPNISFTDAVKLVSDYGVEPYPNNSKELILPCAGKYPLTTPTQPYYMLSTNKGVYYVNAISGEIITEKDINDFINQNDLIYKENINEENR